MHILGVGTRASLVVVHDAGTLSAKPSSVYPWCGSKTIHSHSLPVSRCHDNTMTVTCYELAARKMSFWPRTAAAVQPAATLKTSVRIPQGGGGRGGSNEKGTHPLFG